MTNVLIVDDERCNLIPLRAFIENAYPGVTVVTADHGGAAWDIITASGGNFDLVISDTIMPVIGGIELMERIRKEYPDVRTILMSATENSANRGGAHVFLQKPATKAEILGTIKEVMVKP